MATITQPLLAAAIAPLLSLSHHHHRRPNHNRNSLALSRLISRASTGTNPAVVTCSREEPSFSLYNRCIRDRCRTGRIDEAMALVAEMEALGSRPDPASYENLIATLASLGRTLEAESLFHETVSFGTHGNTRMKSRLYNVLLRGYLRKGLLEVAVRVLNAMEEEKVVKNQETYAILLDYYVGAGRLKDSWDVVTEMKERGYRLNSFAYSKIIALYRDNGMWKKAIGVVEEIREMGLQMDLQIYNSVIETFGKCGQLGEALGVFNRMRKQNGLVPHIATWNSLIRWHCHYGDLEGALELLMRMQEQGLYPDPKIFVNLITRLGEQGKWDMMKRSFEVMKCRGNREMAAIYATLVDIYGQYGRFQDAQELINALKSEGLAPSANVFCALANAYAQQEYDLEITEAYRSFMVSHEFKEIGFNRGVQLSKSKQTMLCQGLCEQTIKVLEIMESEGIEPNLIMLNMLINAFGTAGRHMEALSVFHHIKDSGFSPDLVTYSTLMKAFIRAKQFDKVPAIYKEMESSGCIADRKARQLLQSALMVLEKRHH